MNFPNINPVILSIGPFHIRWYSLAYVLGIFLGWFYGYKLTTKFKLNITKKQLENFVTWAILGIILGGRLGYILFYDPARYLANPISILKTYEGGMSFHGGVIGLIISIYLFSKKYKISFLSLTDIVSTVAPIGLFLGRIANFINGELYGRITSHPIGIVFPNSDMLPRHPSQLYEAFFEGIILFIILAYSSFFHKTIQVKGLNFGIFLSVYSIFRITLEIFREPDFHIGFIFNNLTMGQILSLPMLLLGIYFTLRIRWILQRK